MLRPIPFPAVPVTRATLSVFSILLSFPERVPICDYNSRFFAFRQALRQKSRL